MSSWSSNWYERRIYIFKKGIQVKLNAYINVILCSNQNSISKILLYTYDSWKLSSGVLPYHAWQIIIYIYCNFFLNLWFIVYDVISLHLSIQYDTEYELSTILFTKQ